MAMRCEFGTGRGGVWLLARSGGGAWKLSRNSDTLIQYVGASEFVLNLRSRVAWSDRSVQIFGKGVSALNLAQR